jgi:hypothetical protein
VNVAIELNNMILLISATKDGVLRFSEYKNKESALDELCYVPVHPIDESKSAENKSKSHHSKKPLSLKNEASSSFSRPINKHWIVTSRTDITLPIIGMSIKLIKDGWILKPSNFSVHPTEVKIFAHKKRQFKLFMYLENKNSQTEEVTIDTVFSNKENSDLIQRAEYQDHCIQSLERQLEHMRLQMDLMSNQNLRKRNYSEPSSEELASCNSTIHQSSRSPTVSESDDLQSSVRANDSISVAHCSSISNVFHKGNPRWEADESDLFKLRKTSSQVSQTSKKHSNVKSSKHDRPSKQSSSDLAEPQLNFTPLPIPDNLNTPPSVAGSTVSRSKHSRN